MFWKENYRIGTDNKEIIKKQNYYNQQLKDYNNQQSRNNSTNSISVNFAGFMEWFLRIFFAIGIFLFSILCNYLSLCFVNNTDLTNTFPPINSDIAGILISEQFDKQIDTEELIEKDTIMPIMHQNNNFLEITTPQDCVEVNQIPDIKKEFPAECDLTINNDEGIYNKEILSRIVRSASYFHDLNSWNWDHDDQTIIEWINDNPKLTMIDIIAPKHYEKEFIEQISSWAETYEGEKNNMALLFFIDELKTKYEKTHGNIDSFQLVIRNRNLSNLKLDIIKYLMEYYNINPDGFSSFNRSIFKFAWKYSHHFETHYDRPRPSSSSFHYKKSLLGLHIEFADNPMDKNIIQKLNPFFTPRTYYSANNGDGIKSCFLKDLKEH